MTKKLMLLVCALLIVLAGCAEEQRMDRSETQEGTAASSQTQAGTVAPSQTQGAVAPSLTQKEADAVLALASEKSGSLLEAGDVTPEAVAKLENTVVTSDYLANFGRSNAKMLADAKLPAEVLAIATLKILQSEAAAKSSLSGNTMTIPNLADTVLEKTDVVFKYSGGKWLIDNIIFTIK